MEVLTLINPFTKYRHTAKRESTIKVQVVAAALNQESREPFDIFKGDNFDVLHVIHDPREVLNSNLGLHNLRIFLEVLNLAFRKSFLCHASIIG